MPEEKTASAAVIEKEPTPSSASQDDILTRLEQGAAEEPSAEVADASAPAEKPAGEEPELSEEEKAAAEAAAAEAEAEPDLEAKPELPEDAFHKYREKGLFKEYPELRNVIGQHQAYAEIGSVSELRGLREAFPTPEDVETAKQQAEQLTAFGEAYRSSPEEFLTTLHKMDANALRGVAEKMPEFIHQTDPQLYSNQAYAMAEQVLATLQRTAAQRGDQELADALDIVVGKTYGNRTEQARTTGPDPRDQEIARLKKEKQEREEADRRQAYESFTREVTDGFHGAMSKDIGEWIEKHYPAVDADVRTEMAEKAWSTLLEKMAAQPATVSKIQAAMKAAVNGKNGPSERKALVEFQNARGKQILPLVLKELAQRWTKLYVGAQQTKQNKQAEVAAKTKETKGAGAAPAKPSTTQPWKPPKPKSEEEIFARLEAGR